MLLACEKEKGREYKVGVPDCVIEHSESVDSVIPNSVKAVIEDMTLPHEGVPNGLPETMDWKYAPRLSWGNEPPEDWSAMIPWGQVYRDLNPIEAENTRIQLRQIRAWYLSKATNEWTRWIETSNIEGAYYVEDFAKDVSAPADIRQEEEGISIRMIDGYNFHFWPAEGRVSMDPTDIRGVWVSIDARLIPDIGAYDDRCAANFMLSVGADYWKSVSAEWDNFKTNGDIGIGRFKYLNASWITCNMHSLPIAERDRLKELLD